MSSARGGKTGISPSRTARSIAESSERETEYLAGDEVADEEISASDKEDEDEESGGEDMVTRVWMMGRAVEPSRVRV